MEISKKYINDLTYVFLGCCMNVHNELGPGLLESVYHQCLIEELKYERINFRTELTVPLKYRNKNLNTNLRVDLLIENCLVAELKSTNEIKSIFEAQLLTYMLLLKTPKGILVNFNCNNIFKEGQKTFVNNYFSELPKV